MPRWDWQHASLPDLTDAVCRNRYPGLNVCRGHTSVGPTTCGFCLPLDLCKAASVFFQMVCASLEDAQGSIYIISFSNNTLLLYMVVRRYYGWLDIFQAWCWYALQLTHNCGTKPFELSSHFRLSSLICDRTVSIS